MTHKTIFKISIPIRIARISVSVFILFLMMLTSSYADNDLAVIFKDRGNEYYKAKEYSLAIREYTKALMENPDYPEAFFNRGLANFDLHLYYKAIVDFDMAILLNPNDSDYYFSRGLAYNKVNKPSLALADIKKASSMGDSDATALLNSGLLSKRIDAARQKNLKIESFLRDKGTSFNRKTNVLSRNNEFGGDTVETTYSKGDPLYDGKEGLFKKIEYFDSENRLKKAELLHTGLFNTNNGRNKTILWYNNSSIVIKKIYFYTGKMLNIQSIHEYDDLGNLTSKGLFDAHGKPVTQE